MSEVPTIDNHRNTSGSQPLVTELRNRLIERLGHAVHRMMEKVDDALFELAEKSENIANQSLYFDAMREVRLKRATIENSFRVHFSEAFDTRARRPVGAGDTTAEVESKQGEWGLVDHDAVEEQIAVNNLSDKVGNTCREELYALDQRVSALLGAGAEEVPARPAAPELVCESIRRSLADLQSGLKVRLIILKLFDRYVAGELLVIYHDCNQWMIGKGILPELRTQVRNPRTSRGMVAATSPTGAAGDGDPAPLDEAGLVQALRSLLTGEGIPGGMGGGGGPVAVAGSLSGLTALQRGDGQSWKEMVTGDVAWMEGLRGEVNVLRSLAGTGVARAFGPAGDLTIDIVAMLFDYLLDDRNIPSPLRALIGRLQIPVVKVALLDTGFFSRKSHPARRLLNTLAEAAAGWTGVADASDPLYGTMERLVTRVNREFEQDVALLALVLDEFERFLVEEGERRQLRAERTRRVIGARGEAALLRDRVRAEVGKRTSDGTLNDMVRGFLATHWHQLLQVLAQQHGIESAPWRDALLTMDDLLASVAPKTAMEERRRLSALLPDLLTRLKAGMERIGVPAPARKRFLMDLARVHSDAVRGRDTAGSGSPVLPEEAAPATDATTTTTGVDAWPPEFDASPGEEPAAFSQPAVETGAPAVALASVARLPATEIVDTTAEALPEPGQPEATTADIETTGRVEQPLRPSTVPTLDAAAPVVAGRANAEACLTAPEAGPVTDSPSATANEGFPMLMDAASIGSSAAAAFLADPHATPRAGIEPAATDPAPGFASVPEPETIGMSSASEASVHEAASAIEPMSPRSTFEALTAAARGAGAETATAAAWSAVVTDEGCPRTPGHEHPAGAADGEFADEAATVQRLHAPALPPSDRNVMNEEQVAPLPRPSGSVMPFELSQRQARRITEDLVRLTGNAPIAPVLPLRRGGGEEPSLPVASVSELPLIELSAELAERTQPQGNLADVLRARLLQDGEVSLSDFVDPALIEERLARTLPEEPLARTLPQERLERTLPEEPLTRTLPQERLERTLPLHEAETPRAVQPGAMSAEQILAMMASGELDFEEVTLSDAHEADRPGSHIAAEDGPTRLVAALETGTWIEFTEEDGSRRQARLTWINSSTDTFMFTDRRGLKVADRTRNGLIADFRRGAAQLVEQTGTFDQWMGRLMDGLGRAKQR